VTKLDEPVGYVCGIETEVFGAELLATSPVTDGGCAKDAPAAHGVEEVGVVIWIHEDSILVWLLVYVYMGKGNARRDHRDRGGRRLDTWCFMPRAFDGYPPPSCPAARPCTRF